MILLLFFAFLSGLVTILAPCIWPLLPIILSSSVSGREGHHRPLGITLGIIVSFGIFTLTISSLVRVFHFDPNVLRLIAVVVIGFLGLTMIIPSLSRFMEVFVSRLAGSFGGGIQKGNGFGTGFITGLSLGIVWSPCAGPILAAIAALAATGKVTGSVVLVTIAYVVGVWIPLFIFAYGGQQIILKTRFISTYTGRIQQAFGIIMLLTALAIYTNYDIYLQTRLLNLFPQFSTTIDSFESNSAVKQQLDILKGNSSAQHTQIDTSGLFNTDYAAPDFTGITDWLNSKPLSIKDLKGKVVLVDFWTYTCINCIRTLPHVTSWYEKYKNQGFVVVGVHTPEFVFEHDTNNVMNALKTYSIHYPVAQDNNYTTWNAYTNQYWPAEYLIDANGHVRRTHFGEGEYDQSEMAIQTLLREAGRTVTQKLDIMADQTPTGQISPETYVGSNRAQYYFPDGTLISQTKTFALTEQPDLNSFSLGGVWTIEGENAVTGNNAVLVYHFSANKVFLVLRPGSSGSNAKVKVLVDGKTADGTNAGSDVKNGEVMITTDRLYNLVDLRGSAGNHLLKLEFDSPGIQVFAFTFG